MGQRMNRSREKRPEDWSSPSVAKESPGPRFSLFDQEEALLAHAEEMVGKLDQVADGVRALADAYRQSYRSQTRLLRMSDRMQLDLQQANQKLEAQAESLRTLNEALEKEVQARETLAEELHRLAMMDDLTGVYSRRQVLEVGERELARRRRQGLTPLTLLMMDLDHFKRINDKYGHAAGDTVLVAFSEVLRRNLRESDAVGRLGGEEFLAVLPDVDLQGGLALAERIRSEIAELRIPWQEEAIRLTVSIGVAGILAVHESLDDTIMRADDALYQAKVAGRNRVTVAGSGAQGPEG
ncbi:diguanylate cyclase [Alkalilimnicola ehrlichii MLHE-1]|uniref:diguanylate cyclase n=2 Tax=Alkalilimnicola ehrlichii TaxID=351052 RepID=Q0A9X2_ALKEH|nr:diguanylate cyclase [Alkalilimnicola ehrlichii MLHE-1]